ncbi:MAG: hypothetical protein HYS07_00410 [Chlamydiae bacterium]|nr:hypothetical protein [Chlamydiota bacterium]MBI3278121.1 hypothetical protein [Chlamydiota bacterium]
MMSISQVLQHFKERFHFDGLMPRFISEEVYTQFLKGDIYKRARLLHHQAMEEDRFGYKSRRTGIFGESAAQDRKAIAQYLLEKKSEGARVMIHVGIGGQALGNRAQIESVGEALGYRVYVLEKLGVNFHSLASEIYEQGFKASQILIHASSKSGTTDETMINFQNAFRLLIRGLGQELGENSKVTEEWIIKYETSGDLTKMKLVDLGLTLNQKKLLQKALDRVLFSTTTNVKQSRIYALATSRFIKELSQEIHGESRELITFPIPDNVGGRFSRRSQSGEISAGFAGRNIFKMNEGALNILPFFEKESPEENPALKLALLIYLLKKDFIVICVQASNQIAVADALRQLFPESNGKDGQGPFIVSSVGARELKERIESNLNAFYVLINAQNDRNEKLKLLTLTDCKPPFFEYRQLDLSEEEEAMRDLFFDEVTIWYGLLSAGEITADIHSEAYKKRDPQNQPFVEFGKKLMVESVSKLSRDLSAVQLRYKLECEKVEKGPCLLSIDLFKSGHLCDSKKIDEGIQSVIHSTIRPASQALKESNFSESELFKLLGEVEELKKERRTARGIKEREAMDQKVESLFMKLLDVGYWKKSSLIDSEASRLAALILMAKREGKISLPIFYSACHEAETLGEWWRFLGGRYLNDYGLGTREQHSYFQSLLDGKEVVLPMLVDFVTPFSEIEVREEMIQAYGLAKDYLKGFYPDEIRRLYLEAQGRTFTEIAKRSKMILKFKDLSSKQGKIEVYQFWGRVLAILNGIL